MKIKVIQDNPDQYQTPENKSHLIGKTFEVIETNPFGIYIEDNNGDKWLLNETEYKEVN